MIFQTSLMSSVRVIVLKYLDHEHHKLIPSQLKYHPLIAEPQSQKYMYLPERLLTSGLLLALPS